MFAQNGGILFTISADAVIVADDADASTASAADEK